MPDYENLYQIPWCSELDMIEKVIIEDGVTNIGVRAFNECKNLTSISIPNSVTSIGDYAFFGCSGLTSITIPNSVASIEDCTLAYCSGLTSIIVEQGNKKYDSRNNCNAIIEKESNALIAGCKKTVIPNSVTSIGSWAFYGCSDLTSITIPNSVTGIGKGAFCDCSGLTSVTIPNSVTSIGDDAFYGCSGLTSITIPNSVTSIGDYAFRDCSNLTSITIPNSVTGIGDYAFAFCSGLTSITIPNSVTSIGDYAFRDCSNLTSITIPNSVTGIGDYAFAFCSGLTSIIVEQGNEKYDSRDNCNAIIEKESNALIAGCNKTVIPNSVTGIGVGAFCGCSGLASITIPNSVTSIGEYAFDSCSGLTSITIPNSVASIGDGPLIFCSGLTSIIVEQGNKKYDSRNNCNAIIEKESNALIAGCKKTVIPNSVTSIGVGAFCGCSGLTSITIPNSVTSIGEYAFENCYLTSVTNLATTPQKMDYNMFLSNCTLHVLPGCKAKYEAANVWRNLFIVEDATTGINVVENTSTISSDKVFSISGQRLNNTKKGVNIINGKKILMK